jgi:hypothetical protein
MAMQDDQRPRSATWMPVSIFYDSDFPSMATHTPQSVCGYSLYKGVLLQWGEDHDPRILAFVDSLPQPAREQLLIVQEHEGGIALVWNYSIPTGFEEGGEVEVAGDYWSILSSRTIRLDPSEV